MTWRRAFAVALPLAAAAAAAVVLFPGSRQPTAVRTVTTAPPEEVAPTISDTPLSPPHAKAGASRLNFAAGAGSTAQSSAGADSAVPATNPNRVQRVTASLQLRVADAQAVSDCTKQAESIARSLGGYPSRLDVNAQGRTGYAELTFRIPKQNLQKAVTRLSALGTITGENVSIQDIQAQVDATTRKLARLQARRAAWENQPQTDETQQHIVALTDQIVKLRRGRTNTIRSASFAILGVEMTTRQAPAPVHHGKSQFHGLGVAFRWIGIGAVYAFALGGPVVLVAGLAWLAARGVRRRREESLLSRA